MVQVDALGALSRSRIGYDNNIPISQNNIIPVNNVVPNNAVNLSVFPQPSGNVNARLNSFLLPNSSML